MLTQLWHKFAPSDVRAVLDTNVLVSGTIVRLGASARIVNAALEGKIQLVVSQTSLDEYTDVMKRPHITKKYKEIETHIRAVLVFMQERTIRVVGNVQEAVIKDDPDDDFLLACAEEGRARYIVSGDEHLLKLGTYRNIRILTPREFVEQVLDKL